MTPQTTRANLALWGAAFTVALILSFLSGVATHWPEHGPIDWRGVALDIIQTILTTVPLIAAGLGLPRLGKEAVATLVSEVGAGSAQAALQSESDRQAGLPPPPLSDADVERLAVAVLAHRAHEEAP